MSSTRKVAEWSARAHNPKVEGCAAAGGLSKLRLHVEADPETAPTVAVGGTRVAFAFETSVRVSSMPAAVRDWPAP